MERSSVEKGLVTTQSLLMPATEVEQADIPAWVKECFQALQADFMNEETPFPCVFGVEGFKQNSLRFTFAEDPTNKEDLMRLREALIEYTGMFRTLGRMTSLICFFKPTEQELSVESYEEYFWNILNFLHENDPQEWPGDIPKNADDPMWEFCFNGEPIFVVCNTPAHVARRSRHGKGFLVTLQPRWVFEELKGEKGQKGREVVRKRLEKYDTVPIHPAMGEYGDPNNREWKQYFVHDDNESGPSQCPFHFLHGAGKDEE